MENCNIAIVKGETHTDTSPVEEGTWDITTISRPEHKGIWNGKEV